MSFRLIIALLAGSLIISAARRSPSDTTYRWKERMDAVGRILDLKDHRFLGAGFYIEKHGVVLTASHVAEHDTVLFEHVHSLERDTLVTRDRVTGHDLAILGSIKPTVKEHFGLRFGYADEALDSVIYLGLREDRTLFRFDAAVSAIGDYVLPGDSAAVRAMAIDAQVLGGMSGGPVLNRNGGVIGILIGRLIDSPQGGEDSTAVLAIPTDTLRAILESSSGELRNGR